jgi:hypothetical protein
MIVGMRFGILHPKEKKDYIIKAQQICQQIKELDIYGLGGIQLITELQQGFGVAGHLFRESGAVMKLCFTTGMIFGLTQDTIGYTPDQWKKQLPKCVVRARLARIYPKLLLYKKEIIKCDECKQKHRKHDLNHNIVDAIGIGHFHIFGRLS